VNDVMAPRFEDRIIIWWASFSHYSQELNAAQAKANAATAIALLFRLRPDSSVRKMANAMERRFAMVFLPNVLHHLITLTERNATAILRWVTNQKVGWKCQF
jgi:hypothetical protein